MKKLNFISKALVSLIILTGFSAIRAMEGGAASTDPLKRLDYRKAFDQKKIFEKFESLMLDSGCADNVFIQGEPDAHATLDTCPSVCISISKLCQNGYQLLPTSQHVLDEQAFQAACIAQLRSARRNAILKPAREAASMIGYIAAGTTGLVFYTGRESFGGSFGIFGAFSATTYYVRKIINSLLELSQPYHPLDALEQRYAINQRYIPHELWPIIIDRFSLARTDTHHQPDHLKFLEFAIGLTTFKPKPALHSRDTHIKSHEAMEALCPKINEFFKGYEQKPEEMERLKTGIRIFLETLLDGEKKPTRYLFLVGPGGIGKNHFVSTLYGWLNELLPSSISLCSETVHSPADLEGDERKQGIWLKALQKQLSSDSRGLIIFMDEATWLNNKDLVSDAKQAFNGNFSEISTKYFGPAVDVKLPMPPMLVFVASNEPIQDIPLDSRFGTINFPIPTKETLSQHALAICHDDPAYKHAAAETQTIIAQALEQELQATKPGEGIMKTYFRSVGFRPGEIVTRHTCK